MNNGKIKSEKMIHEQNKPSLKYIGMFISLVKP